MIRHQSIFFPVAHEIISKLKKLFKCVASIEKLNFYSSVGAQLNLHGY